MRFYMVRKQSILCTKQCLYYHAIHHPYLYNFNPKKNACFMISREGQCTADIKKLDTNYCQ